MKLQQILESLSSIVYHYTSIDSAYKIIKDGAFTLTNSIGSSEASYTPSNQHYFLSTTRSVTGAYHHRETKNHPYGVMLVLDGDYYNNSFKSKPVSYWGHRTGSGAELEDRLFSKTNKLSISGVKEAHILFSPDHSAREHFSDDIESILRKIILECNRKNIKTFFYTDKNSWLLLDKNKTAKPSEIIGYEGNTKPFRETKPMSAFLYKKRINDLTYWSELVFKKDTSELSIGANKILTNILSSQRFQNEYNNFELLWSNNSEAKTSHPHNLDMIANITKYMNDHKFKTLKSLFDNVRDKWKTITDNKKG